MGFFEAHYLLEKIFFSIALRTTVGQKGRLAPKPTRQWPH